MACEVALAATPRVGVAALVLTSGERHGLHRAYPRLRAGQWKRQRRIPAPRNSPGVAGNCAISSASRACARYSDLIVTGKKSRNRSTHGSHSSSEPAAGEAATGAAFDPKALPDESSVGREHPHPRAAPAPGSPLSHQELERLKSKAVKSSPPTSQRGQSDPAAKGSKAKKGKDD